MIQTNPRPDGKRAAVSFLGSLTLTVAAFLPGWASAQSKLWYWPASYAGSSQCVNPGAYGADPNSVALQKERQNNALTTMQCYKTCRNPYTDLGTTITGPDSADGQLRSNCTGSVYRYTIRKINNPKQPVCDASETAANPCNLASGAKVQSATDYQDPGGDLSLTRIYNSHSAELFFGPFGRNWQSNFDRQALGFPIQVNATDVRAMTALFWQPGGRGLSFHFDSGTQQWTSDPDISERVTQLVTAQGMHSGWILESGSRVHREIYDSIGHLVRLEDARGAYVWLTYAANGLLSKVTDRTGRSLVFNSNGTNIVEVVLPDGYKINYAYGAGMLSEVIYPDATPVTQADNHRISYLYEKVGSPQLLTGIFDESGVRSSSWDYDAQQRVTLSVHGDLAAQVDRVSIMYGADGSATLTQPLGKQTTLTFSEVQGLRRTSGMSGACPSCNGPQFAQKSFDTNGYPDVTVDLLGNRTDLDFDASGRLVQEIDGANAMDGEKRTKQTDWHAVFAVPVERRTYDAAGALVGKEVWTYNDRGQVLTRSVSEP